MRSNRNRRYLITLSLAFLLAGTLSPAAAGRPPSSNEAINASSSAATPGAHLSRQVYAYVNTGDLDHVDSAGFRWDAITDLVYFGIEARPDGRLRKTDADGSVSWGWSVWTGPRMSRIINRAHERGVRVVLSVTRFAWTEAGARLSTRLLESGVRRQRLAREIAAAVRERGVDGVNLDFEPIPSGQRTNFVRLVRAVRAALDEAGDYELTVATTGFIANYDVAGITAPGAAHAIYIMAYHYRGGWSATAGSIAPLWRDGYDIRDTVNAYLRYTTANRLILGLPLYGFVWPTVSSTVRSETRPPGETYGYPSSVVYGRAVELAAQYGRLWDEAERGPWARWQARACNSCPLTWRQLYYDDRESMGLKFGFAERRGLRGIGLWALGYERERDEINDLIVARFGTP